jgi:AcrR family transcriptional regulator
MRLMTEGTIRRDPVRTKQRILSAAKREFAAKGFAGARVASIATRARVNKRMLYHYFGDKRGLYRAVIDDQVERHGRLTGENPPDPLDAIPYWYREVVADLEWTRLLAWEALAGGPSGNTVGEAGLRRNYEPAVAWIRAAQRDGLLADDIDPELFLLSTIALNMFPTAFPNIARSVTGVSPFDDAFHGRYVRFLERFAEAMRPDPDPAP